MNNFFSTNVGKSLIAVAYVAFSQAVAYVITLTTNDPASFGNWTIFVNAIAVFVYKTYIDKATPNLGDN